MATEGNPNAGSENAGERRSSVLGSYQEHAHPPLPAERSHGTVDNIIGTLHKDQESPYHKGATEGHTAREQFYHGHNPEHEFKNDEVEAGRKGSLSHMLGVDKVMDKLHDHKPTLSHKEFVKDTQEHRSHMGTDGMIGRNPLGEASGQDGHDPRTAEKVVPDSSN